MNLLATALALTVIDGVGHRALREGKAEGTIWIYLSEIFPTAVRAKGQSLGASVHWLANAMISGLFPVIAARSAGYPFALFAGMMVLRWLPPYPVT